MDFYIPYYKLDIELDGKQHRDIEHFKRDVEKSEFLWNDEHIATVRISNEKVRELQRLDIQAIWECVDREKSNKKKCNRKGIITKKGGVVELL